MTRPRATDRRALVVAVLVGLLGGLGAFTLHYADATAYLSNDPKACANCHVMRDHLDGWQKSSHHAFATCNDCHVPQGFPGKWIAKATNGYRHSKGFTLQDFHEPIRIHPENAVTLRQNCVRCHREVVSGLTAHGDVDCVRCHDRVGHGPSR